MKLYQTYYEVFSEPLCDECGSRRGADKEIMPIDGVQCEHCSLRISAADLRSVLRLANISGLNGGGISLPKTQEELAGLIAEAKKLEKLLP